MQIKRRMVNDHQSKNELIDENNCRNYSFGQRSEFLDEEILNTGIYEYSIYDNGNFLNSKMIEVNNFKAISIYYSLKEQKINLRNLKPNTQYHFQITSSFGQLQRMENWNNDQEVKEIDLSNLNSGVYFIRISSENDQIIKKIIIE